MRLPIPLPERVNGIQLRKAMRRTCGKLVGTAILEEAPVLEPREQPLHLTGDVFGIAECAPTLRQTDGAKPPGPAIHILKEVAMDGP